MKLINILLPILFLILVVFSIILSYNNKNYFYIIYILIIIALFYIVNRTYNKKKDPLAKNSAKKRYALSRNLEELPLNRYPFIGSHDAATGYPSQFISLPFVKTQSLQFLDQYTIGGINFYDLRIDIYSGNKLQFKHGPVRLQYVEDDISFYEMLRKAVNDKKLIILYISHYDASTREKISVEFNKYLEKVGLLTFAYTITDISELNKRVNEFLNRNKYIINVFQDYVDDNFNKDIGCFIDTVVPYYDDCKAKSCLGSTHKNWDALDAYVRESYVSYMETRPDKMFIIQTMFQAAPTSGGKEAAVYCLGVSDQAVNTEISAKVNKAFLSFFKVYDKMVPNVIIFDNVGPTTKKIKTQITSNYTK